MPHDIALVLGVVLIWLAVPSMISALVDRRAPRVALGVAALGVVFVVRAIAVWPGAFHLRDLPDAFIDVLARVI
ncbi:MAG: hypothetical protein NXH82_00940 [Rhodobacteraceae bacterium]|nr:hypothetical protein [Paracoccaceae bacterium]